MELVLYRSAGAPDRLRVRGRVLADKGLRPARPEDRTLRNLRNMRKRMLSRPIPYATLELRHGDVVARVEADDLGYFDAWLRPSSPLPREVVWHEVEVTLVAPVHPRQGPVRGTAYVRVAGTRARFVVVSDLDDTVVRTGATRLVSLLRESFSGNAYTRVPFPGVAALYRALRRGESGLEDNPLLFVSRSPWNLHDLFDQFLRIHGIDDRPVVLLRRWGFTDEGLTVADVRGLKYRLVRELLDLHPGLPFILVGDSGQKDPEIYREVIRHAPGRVLAVYIRNVTRDPARVEAIRALAREVAQQGATLVLAADTLEMARHAARNGWISGAAVAAVAGEREVDHAAGAQAVSAAPPRTVGARGEHATAAAVDRTLRRQLEAAEHEGAPLVVGPRDGGPSANHP
jgi:phosphatidate phosphatase APP1